MSGKNNPNRYVAILSEVFKSHYKKGVTEFAFTRDEFATKAEELGITLPKNLGDVLYSFRYRVELPETIRATAKPGFEWFIIGAGKAKYSFKQLKPCAVLPRDGLVTVKVPDSTPEIINAYAQSDEQALLARVRYNRLIDIFLGITTYSLQNHMRTTVAGLGQIEIDEIYVGIDKQGRQYVVPVQAKGGNDKHSLVQTLQDVMCCNERFPHLICRPVSAQFMKDSRIALFELTFEDGEMQIVDERHYNLFSSKEISAEELKRYATRQ